MVMAAQQQDRGLMRIALMPSAYAPQVGGVEVLTARLAQSLRERGHVVEVWAPRHPGDALPERETHDGIDVLRAAMEGVAFRLEDIFTRLQKVAKIEEIVASGGALRESPVWTQIIADTLGRDLTISGVKEASMRGAVLLAMESVGKIESIEKFLN